jgi:hypothetical protein
MSLRERAAADTTAILTNQDHFGWLITVIDPDGLSASITGFSNDIAQAVDPQTGQVVSGRLATVALSISTLNDAGFTSLPVGIADTNRLPWIVSFNDVQGDAYTFKISVANPDRTLGVVVCYLEAYNP